MANVTKEARKRGCETIQIFIQSPRSWASSSFTDEEARLFKNQLKREKIYPLAIHAPYLINLVSSSFSLRLKSAYNLIEHLNVGKKIGADFVVFHPGSNKLLSLGAQKKFLLDSLEFILSKAPAGSPMLLLENVAQKESAWSSLTILVGFIKSSGLSRKIGLCFDTAHAQAAGYDLSKRKGWSRVVSELQQPSGSNYLKLIHANDSFHHTGSGRDKHADIGQGEIGLTGFSILVNHPLFSDLPCILETPKMTFQDDLRNLSIIRQLVKNKVRKKFRGI